MIAPDPAGSVSRAEPRPTMSIVVTGRNDDYGGSFAERLFRTVGHNLGALTRRGVAVELVFVEWNPPPDRSLLAPQVAARWPGARAFVVPADIHDRYSLDAAMPFHEMAAKNVGLRRARGDWVLSTNADVLLDDRLVERLARGRLREDTLYRAHRIDIGASVPWTERDEPRHHRRSGECARPPAYYVGAAGDFCFASATLWHRLRGYNERVRFSTRAKDWQFCLTAATLGVPIEFIGQVLHLAHASGFQHASPAERDSSRAHFGGPWDIEYGLPVLNDATWGLGDLGERNDPAARGVVHLVPSPRDPADEEAGRRLRTLLTARGGRMDDLPAVLLHAAWAAASRDTWLLADLRDPWACARFAGVACVLERFGVRAASRSPAPDLPGHAVPSLRPWPDALPAGAIVVSDKAGDGRLYVGRTFRSATLPEAAGGTGRWLDPVEVLPRARPAARPRFDPMLAHRLLRAWLRLRAAGARRFALFGAGGHTEALLRWGVPDALEAVAIVASAPRAPSACGLPVVAPERFDPRGVDAVLLSSITYEPEMLEEATRRGWGHVIPLYLDWPPDAWRAGAREEPFPA